ncbi:hypothetical protein NVP1170O_183 [Vibrio phage 1.170.O._10N.261.52.C3]|nr:hypothetical protein NVP1170O_183 [Vibrio phage 1.170.O._10N.261.52.C3]
MGTEFRIDSSGYERFREEGWKSYEDCAKVISYFCPRKSSESEVSGKEMTLRQESFWKDVDIHKAFRAYKSCMATQKGLTRKKMLSLKPHETYAWSALLEYLRVSWREGEKVVTLSSREFEMLFG